MEEEFLFSGDGLVECYDESSNEITSSFKVNSHDCKVKTEEGKWLLNNAKNDNERVERDNKPIFLKQEIKTEYAVVKEEFIVSSERSEILEKIEGNGEFFIETETEKQETINKQLDDQKIILGKDQYTTFNGVKVKEESEPLQCIKQEEISIEYAYSNNQDLVKNEIVEGNDSALLALETRKEGERQLCVFAI